MISEKEFMFYIYSALRDFHWHQEKMQRVITNSYPLENCPWKYRDDSTARAQIQTQVLLKYAKGVAFHLTKSHFVSEQNYFHF